MRNALAVAAFGVSLVLPLVAFAQPGPPSPSPELRSMMERVHAEARTAAYAALTPAHTAAVSAIASQVAAGTLDRRAAVQQIDALLTPDERKGVMTAAYNARRTMFEAMAAAGAGPMMERGGRPGGPPPGGPQSGGRPPGGPPPGGPALGGPSPGSPPAAGPPDRGRPPVAGGPPGGPGGRFRRPSPGRYLLMVSLTPEQMRRLMPRARSSSAP
jgi:hypothetical protein